MINKEPYKTAAEVTASPPERIVPGTPSRGSSVVPLSTTTSGGVGSAGGYYVPPPSLPLSGSTISSISHANMESVSAPRGVTTAGYASPAVARSSLQVKLEDEPRCSVNMTGHASPAVARSSSQVKVEDKADTLTACVY